MGKHIINIIVTVGSVDYRNYYQNAVLFPYEIESDCILWNDWQLVWFNKLSFG